MVDREGKLKQDLHRFRPTGEAQIPMALHGEGSAAAGAEAESPSTDDSPEPSLESDGDASNVEGVLVDVRSMVLLMVKLSKAYAEKQADLDDYSDLFDGCLNKGA